MNNDYKQATFSNQKNNKNRNETSQRMNKTVNKMKIHKFNHHFALRNAHTIIEKNEETLNFLHLI